MQELQDFIKECKSIRLLYVEDDESVREQFYDLLSIIFDNIDIACDGLEALKCMEKCQYDLIITDIFMPNMDGIELIEHIRRENKNQKIIITSAYEATEYLVKSIFLDVDGYLFKPVEIDAFKQILLKIVKEIRANKLLESYYKELEHEVQVQTEKIAKQSMTDELTGLFNRKALELSLEHRKAKTLILISIDSFDSLNITYGYANGNHILKKLAEYLKMKDIPNAKAYHLYGGKFVLLLDNIENDQKVEELAYTIQKEVDALDIVVDKFIINITVSLAIAEGRECLLENAHMALQESKKRGKHNIFIYNDNLSVLELQRRIKQYVPLLKEAIEKDFITPYFQPIINNTTKQIEKFESLARIIDENDEVHYPADFVPVANITNMTPDITRVMIDKTFCAFAKNSYKFSLNVSEYDLSNEYLVPYIEEKIAQYGIDPKRIIVEILEGVHTSDIDIGLIQLMQLKKLGLSIAIDDFGVENSNFERVHRLRVDFIKIDGKYIKDIDVNDNSFKIAQTITQFAKSMGAEVIAEYVHSPEVLEKVLDLGIDYSQGYYFAQPQKEIVYEL